MANWMRRDSATTWTGSGSMNSLQTVSSCTRIPSEGSRQSGATEPSYTIRDFYELREILRTDFGVRI